MDTVTDQRPVYRHDSRPRRGFPDSRVADQAALIFRAAGITADLLRDGAHPEDALLAELADRLAALDAGGSTRPAPAACSASASRLSRLRAPRRARPRRGHDAA